MKIYFYIFLIFIILKIINCGNNRENELKEMVANSEYMMKKLTQQEKEKLIEKFENNVKSSKHVEELKKLREENANNNNNI
ncbi:hypothetical protein Mgra_00006915 [Meloidogyne graminicola]|uniref:Uncharacterized protein n=1 Tax=Meloidogyne graminicola TaxID=189291 RepID=A0A8S9ZKM7_9BILA|nr:hypothetical protein Mgra_00006915 [Meloidogyne graminicola]